MTTKAYRSFKKGYSDVRSGRARIDDYSFLKTVDDFTGREPYHQIRHVAKPRLMLMFMPPYSKGQMTGQAINILEDCMKYKKFGFLEDAALDFLKITGSLKSRAARNLVKNLRGKLGEDTNEGTICGQTLDQHQIDGKLYQLGVDTAQA